MNTKFGLKIEIIQKIRAVLLQSKSVEKIIVYGSRAKGNYREGSDIDLTLVGAQLETNDLLRLEGELDDLMLPYKIDLSLLHQIENPNLVEHIQRVGQEFKI